VEVVKGKILDTIFSNFCGDLKPVFKMPFFMNKIFGHIKGHFKNRSEVDPKKSKHSQTGLQ